MTGKTVPTPTQLMCGDKRQIHLTMTIRADHWIEDRDILPVTIAASKRLARDLELVAV